jgi:hypothetical protein
MEALIERTAMSPFIRENGHRLAAGTYCVVRDCSPSR